MKLGHVQRNILEQIAEQTFDAAYGRSRGVALWAMLNLRGKASSYSGRYLAAVSNAVRRHNEGMCESDCPIPSGKRVVASSVGPRGGFGYYVV